MCSWNVLIRIAILLSLSSGLLASPLKAFAQDSAEQKPCNWNSGVPLEESKTQSAQAPVQFVLGDSHGETRDDENKPPKDAPKPFADEDALQELVKLLHKTGQDDNFSREDMREQLNQLSAKFNLGTDPHEAVYDLLVHTISDPRFAQDAPALQTALKSIPLYGSSGHPKSTVAVVLGLLKSKPSDDQLLEDVAHALHEIDPDSVSLYSAELGTLLKKHTGVAEMRRSIDLLKVMANDSGTARKELLTAAKEDSLETRRAASAAWIAIRNLSPGNVKGLTDILGQADDAVIRRNITFSLAKLGADGVDAVPALLGQLKEPAAPNLKETLFALKHISAQSPKVADQLKKLLGQDASTLGGDDRILQARIAGMFMLNPANPKLQDVALDQFLRLWILNNKAPDDVVKLSLMEVLAEITRSLQTQNPPKLYAARRKLEPDGYVLDAPAFSVAELEAEAVETVLLARSGNKSWQNPGYLETKVFIFKEFILLSEISPAARQVILADNFSEDKADKNRGYARTKVGNRLFLKLIAQALRTDRNAYGKEVVDFLYYPYIDENTNSTSIREDLGASADEVARGAMDVIIKTKQYDPDFEKHFHMRLPLLKLLSGDRPELFKSDLVALLSKDSDPVIRSHAFAIVKDLGIKAPKSVLLKLANDTSETKSIRIEAASLLLSAEGDDSNAVKIPSEPIQNIEKQK